MNTRYDLHSWSKQHREMLLAEMGGARKRNRKERNMMNESKLSVTKGMQIAMLTLALLMALTAGLALRLPSAEAAPCSQPYCGYPTFCPTNWTGSSLSESRTGTICVDQMDGAGGDDRLYGREAGDKLVGGSGNDTVWGESGGDTLNGGIGNDSINGGIENDSINGESGNDSINGGSGDDSIWTGADGATVYSEIGNDRIFTDRYSRDNVYAGDGDDTITINTSFDGQIDVYDGGPGTDTVVNAGACSNDWTTDPIDVYVGIEKRTFLIC